MSATDEIYDMLNAEFENIGFSRKSYEIEMTEMDVAFKTLKGKAVTSFDRNKLEDMETIISKR